VFREPGYTENRRSAHKGIRYFECNLDLNDADATELEALVSAQRSAMLRDGHASHTAASTEPPTLKKAELVALLCDRAGLNAREAREMVGAFFEAMSDALENGETVKLSGFGCFQLREKSQHPGRNPKTGETVPIPARRVVTFHASQKLKTRVETGGEQRRHDSPQAAMKRPSCDAPRGHSDGRSTQQAVIRSPKADVASAEAAAVWSTLARPLAAAPGHPEHPEKGHRGWTDQRHNHSASFDQRRSVCLPLTAIASARFCPTSTTRRLPRVMPV
jgi:integration host factor subunit alpha